MVLYTIFRIARPAAEAETRTRSEELVLFSMSNIKNPSAPSLWPPIVVLISFGVGVYGRMDERGGELREETRLKESEGRRWQRINVIPVGFLLNTSIRGASSKVSLNDRLDVK